MAQPPGRLDPRHRIAEGNADTRRRNRPERQPAIGERQSGTEHLPRRERPRNFDGDNANAAFGELADLRVTGLTVCGAEVRSGQVASPPDLQSRSVSLTESATLLPPIR